VIAITLPARDELLSMEPGRKLDMLVAEKAIGIKVAHGAPLPRYSQNISAAWEVAKVMLEKEYRFQLEKRAGRYKAYFDPPLDRTANDSLRVSFYYLFGQGGHGNATPEAICKAALLATLEEEVRARKE